MLKFEASKGEMCRDHWAFGLYLNLHGWGDPIYSERPGRRLSLFLGKCRLTLIVYRMSARKWERCLAEYHRLHAPRVYSVPGAIIGAA